MSLHPEPVGPVPEETARVARAAFARGNPYIRMRDALGGLYEDAAFAPLFAARGRPAVAPWRLALVTVLQFTEGLSDRQAADAVRSRIDWKYALGLRLDDPGFDASVLCEFRARLLAGRAEAHLFEAMLARVRALGLLRVRGRQRTDSTHVLAAVRTRNRLEAVGETMRRALNALAVAAPEWLRHQWTALGDDGAAWVARYGPRVDEYRLPKGERARAAEAERIGRDGIRLLAAVCAPSAPGWLRELPAVETLRQMWVQQYTVADGAIRWRAPADQPPAMQALRSPYDPDARAAKKRRIQWLGYKVHLTETCDAATPHLITHVETTLAPVPDGDATPRIHRALAARGRLPATHLVDNGYVDAELLVASRRDHGVDLLGPVRADTHWQTRAGAGFAAEAFAVDWNRQQLTCPAGHPSASWTPATDRHGNDVVSVKFALADCRACAFRSQCTRSPRAARSVTLRPEAQHRALRAARARQTTAAFAAAAAGREGVEGTLSQAVRRCGLRRARYVGLAKTRLQHLLTAAALNFLRVALWLADTPLATTRRAAFVTLLAPAT